VLSPGVELASGALREVLIRREIYPLGVDEATGEIVAAVAREAGVTEDDGVPDLVEQVDRPIR